MDPSEFEAVLSDAETRLDRVRALYEQYFQGIERAEPMVARKEVDRRIAELRRVRPRNTALRFRFQTLLQRYTTYQSYWRRVVREIEEGTFRRHIERARARFGSKAPPAVASAEDNSMAAGTQRSIASPVPADGVPESIGGSRRSLSPLARNSASTPSAPAIPAAGGGAPNAVNAVAAVPVRAGLPPPAPALAPPVSQDGAAKVAPPPPPAGKRPPPPPPSVAKMPPPHDDPALRRLYEEYISARKRNNERTDHLKYDAVAGKIKTMIPELQKKHAGKRIDFEVVVKDGKVGLKPVVR